MRTAKYPERTCRVAFTVDGLTDHTCDLIDGHPGPDAALSCPASARRREAWEAAHPDWERMIASGDPFAEISPHIPEERS